MIHFWIFFNGGVINVINVINVVIKPAIAGPAAFLRSAMPLFANDIVFDLIISRGKH